MVDGSCGKKENRGQGRLFQRSGPKGVREHFRLKRPAAWGQKRGQRTFPFETPCCLGPPPEKFSDPFFGRCADCPGLSDSASWGHAPPTPRTARDSFAHHPLRGEPRGDLHRRRGLRVLPAGAGGVFKKRSENISVWTFLATSQAKPVPTTCPFGLPDPQVLGQAQRNGVKFTYSGSPQGRLLVLRQGQPL